MKSRENKLFPVIFYRFNVLDFSTDRNSCENHTKKLSNFSNIKLK